MITPALSQHSPSALTLYQSRRYRIQIEAQKVEKRTCNLVFVCQQLMGLDESYHNTSVLNGGVVFQCHHMSVMVFVVPLPVVAEV
jgi:hypothetical protein